MNLILFDDHSWENLLPLTYTRPIAELRMGILTIREKWEWRMNSRATVMTRPYLRELFPADPGEDNLLISAKKGHEGRLHGLFSWNAVCKDMF